MSDYISDDAAQTARRMTDGVDGWIGSVVGMQIVARAIMDERERIAADFARRPNDVWTGEAVASTIRHPS